MKKEVQPQLQQQQQQQQDQLQKDQLLLRHPYMSLYEPVLLQSEVYYFSPPSSESQWQQQQQQQRPDETFSFAVAKQLPPSLQSRINTTTATTTTNYSANNNKRQKVDHNENGIADSTIQYLVHKCEYKHEAMNTSNATIRSFEGHKFDRRWEEMYQRLVAYKKEHKHTKVPIKYKEDPELGRWVDTQRTSYRNKKMTEERKRLLNHIGFLWEGKAPGTSTATWDEMYQRLVAYKKEYNDTKVPQRYKGDPELGRWVDNQRTSYRNKKMTEERKLLLGSIGFSWGGKAPGTSTAAWEEMYRRLVAYKKEHKDTKVPQGYKKDPPLGCWVKTQRTMYKNKKMTELRKCLLDSIGFEFVRIFNGKKDKATWERTKRSTRIPRIFEDTMKIHYLGVGSADSVNDARRKNE